MEWDLLESIFVGDGNNLTEIGALPTSSLPLLCSVILGCCKYINLHFCPGVLHSEHGMEARA